MFFPYVSELPQILSHKCKEDGFVRKSKHIVKLVLSEYIQ